ncbi:MULTISPECIES: LacI family DNA-binding transcriptional regulator [unclassified Microbacterium]|uniref:LacI family DNA-binding transcriptional regulator n=1 Tax=unclassified Microbacterium TaxID=2609290 RepID=UPI0030165C0F
MFLEDPNIGVIVLGANDALSARDSQMVCLIVDSERDTDRVSRYLSGGFVDGAIVVSARNRDPTLSVIERLALPAAFVGHPPGITAPFVGVDNRGASAAITGRLMQTGRRRIGMIPAALDRDSGADRLAGFREALGIAYDPELVVSVPLYSFNDGADWMRTLLQREPAIDGVVASSDAVAAGAVQTLLEAGRSVPEDVGIVGFDDSSWATRTVPALSTVRQPAADLGRAAAEAVLEQIGTGDTTVGGLVLETPIIWRASTGDAVPAA